jgi:hypothetical protein
MSASASSAPETAEEGLTASVWELCLLASAWSVLNAREERKPRRKQAMHELTSADLQTQKLELAKKMRAEMQTTAAQVLQQVLDALACTDEAEDCLQHAARACQVMPTSLGDTPTICVFTGQQQQSQHLQVKLFGNTPQRFEKSWVVRTGWPLKIIKALMVVCNVCEWMDQRVQQWIDAKQVVQITAPLLAELAADLAEPARTAYNEARHLLLVTTVA